ncbi:MAG: TonB-dependent receptor, partial [Bacteroidota bacterium]
TDKLSVSTLGSYANNDYLVIPQTRETTFGTVKQAMQLRMYFEGQDQMQYQTATGALTVSYQPDRFTQLKLISSVFNTNEREFFTIEGAYRLEEVETDFGNDNFGKARATKGIGYFLNNARNQLNATVYNIGHRGYRTLGNNSLQWGVQAQGERITDKINEWDYKDSSDFSQPSQVNGQPVVLNYLNTQVNLNTHRFSGYIQNSQKLNRAYNIIATYGIRSNWWSYNNQNVISPRVQLSMEPNRKYNRAVQNGTIKGTLKRDINLKAAFGFYYQPPFYRELRDFNGKLNPNIKAQKSIHYLFGGDMNFNLWNRKFKWFVEAYYKQLENIIPYEIDNVRIRYYAENNASGYAGGLDMRVNGEFVKGVESWMSLSVMQTQEKITTSDAAGNKTTSPYIPRPTDQRATFSMFFQDYLPNNDKYKVNLTFVFGTGLPFGPPDRNREGDTLRMPSYRRVDIGFLRMLVDEKDTHKKGWNKHIKSAWIGVDIFNLLAINNTISYIWIEDIEARTWAVPNYLTNRRINLRLMVNF